MPAITLEPIDRLSTYKIETRDATLTFDKATGWMRGLLFKARNVDLFAQVRQNLPGYIGGLRIYDERDEKWYSDLNDPFTVSDVRSERDEFSFTKQFSGAPFTLKVVFKTEPDALHWEVTAIKNDKTVADRSLRVYFFLPIIAGWDIWAPAFDSEKTFDGMTSFEYMHIQVPYVSNKETILPMISHFSKELDVGFSMLEPIDAKVPAAKFQFSNGEKCFNWGAMEKDIRSVPVLEAVNYYIGLAGDRPMQTKIMLMFHEGDWRPGLGKVFARWKEYFVPHSDTIYDYEGVFSCEGVESADDLKRCKDFGIKTLEVHGHFEHYGDYLQEGKESWFKLGVKEGYFHKKCRNKNIADFAKLFDAHSDEQLAKKLGVSIDIVRNQRADLKLRLGRKQSGGYATYMDAWLVQKFFDEHDDRQIAAELGLDANEIRHHRSDVKQRLAKLSKAGIGTYWYFNYTDGFRPHVEKRFADSIARNEDGSYQPSGWHMCHNMNADPRWSFGKFMYDSAQKIFKTYPTLNGFFLDCFRHFEIDFAHDDGITVVNNKPAYSMNFSYDDIETKIRREILKGKRATFANKPQSIRSMHWADGVLLEGGGDYHEEKYFWACIAKPLFFMWTSNENSIDENLRRAVYHGSFPKYAVEKNRTYAQNKRHFERYLPLCAQFPRRVFCFEPDPVRVPHGSRAKLYTVGNDYVAGIMSEFGQEGDRVVFKKTPYAAFRVARGHDVGKVGVMLPGQKKFKLVKFKFNGTMIFVPLAGYQNCAVVRLFVTKKSGRSIGPDRFRAHVDYCGDPESSYAESNAR